VALRTLLAALGIVLAVIVVVTWRMARKHPDWALASGLVLASVAYPLAWKLFPTASVPYWAYEAPYYWAAAAIPFLLALTLMRRAGRVTT
jgi:pimeloyl-ACP methyl ester carboxylesterase